jgi:hypothetical protein
MKKLTVLLLLTALSVWAADFWIAKPYTDWNEKDVQKMITDSPWAHRVSVEISFGLGGGRGGPGGPGGSIGGPGTGGRGGTEATSGIAETSGTGGGGGGKGGRGGGGTPGGADQEAPVVQTAQVLLFWQSALPVKQALLKAKYGSEVSTSADAKALISREEQFYVLGVRGLPPTGPGVDLKSIMMQQSSLSVKGKEPVRPADVQIARGAQGVEAYLLFPKTAPFTMDDKEVEFSSKIPRMNIKYKFRLKDMLFNNKLEM